MCALIFYFEARHFQTTDELANMNEPPSLASQFIQVAHTPEHLTNIIRALSIAALPLKNTLKLFVQESQLVPKLICHLSNTGIKKDSAWQPRAIKSMVSTIALASPEIQPMLDLKPPFPQIGILSVSSLNLKEKQVEVAKIYNENQVDLLIKEVKELLAKQTDTHQSHITKDSWAKNLIAILILKLSRSTTSQLLFNRLNEIQIIDIATSALSVIPNFPLCSQRTN